MKFDTVSVVTVPGVGKVTHRQEMTFADDSNVFGRVLEYRQKMAKLFPGCDYELINATQKSADSLSKR